MSIKRRTVITSGFLILFVLPSFAWLLNLAFTKAVTESFDARLQALLNVVIAELHVTPEGGLSMVESLGDRRFNEVYSGWYWQLATDNEPIAASRSLWDQRLTPNPDGTVGNLILRDGIGPQDQRLRVAERDVLLTGFPDVIHVMVGGDTREIIAEVRAFQSVLWPGIVAIGALLGVFLVLQLRWSLAPLRRMQFSLARFRRGQQTRLQGRFPVELQGVVDALNDVLARDERLLARGRETAANLAHSLKTPLAVLKTYVGQLQPEHGRMLGQEITRMEQVIQYQLARANAAGAHQLTQAIDARQALTPVLTMFSRVCQNRGLAFNVRGDTCMWLIAAEDLQEIIGNLLENASKHAHSQIELNFDTQLGILVSDDGPGIDLAEGENIFQRGVRLDEQTPGSGIGLAIVAELVDAYAGSIQLGLSPLGGLEVHIQFPTAIA